MPRSLTATALGLMVSLVPLAAHAQEETSFSFTSEAGDYIGGGQSVSFTLDTASFHSSSSQNDNHVGGHLFPFDGGFWFFDFAAPSGQPLVPGVYEGATRYPFQAPDVPGLSISGDGRGCNVLTGRFEVVEAVYGPLGYVERFHATFEQHCEGSPPALRGEVRIVNPPPPPALTMSVVPYDRGTVDRFGAVVLSGKATCSTAASINLFGLISQRVNRFSLATGTFSATVQCASSATPWAISVKPGGDVPFGPGMVTLELTGSGFDANYGSVITQEIDAAVRLTRTGN